MDFSFSSPQELPDKHRRDLFIFDASLMKLAHDDSGVCKLRPCPTHSRELFYKYCAELHNFEGDDDDDWGAFSPEHYEFLGGEMGGIYAR